MFGITSQMIVVIVSYIQIITKNMVPIINKALKTFFRYLCNFRNLRTHVWLFLSFGLTYVKFVERPFISTSISNSNININDVANILAYKILNIFILFLYWFFGSRISINRDLSTSY